MRTGLDSEHVDLDEAQTKDTEQQEPAKRESIDAKQVASAVYKASVIALVVVWSLVATELASRGSGGALPLLLSLLLVAIVACLSLLLGPVREALVVSLSSLISVVLFEALSSLFIRLGAVVASLVLIRAPPSGSTLVALSIIRVSPSGIGRLSLTRRTLAREDPHLVVCLSLFFVT